MRPLPLVRFNALAGYARVPMTTAFSEETAWFEHGSERVLGIVARDRTDNDFTGIVMARDQRGRFRAVELTSFEPTQRRAEVLLRREMEAPRDGPGRGVLPGRRERGAARLLHTSR